MLGALGSVGVSHRGAPLRRGGDSKCRDGDSESRDRDSRQVGIVTLANSPLDGRLKLNALKEIRR